MSKKRNQRLFTLAVFFVPIALGVFFLMLALRENISYFYSPTDIFEKSVPLERNIRLGGLVKTGSVVMGIDTTETRFILTDGSHEFPISYKGILPDLFREEQGIIAEGKITDNTFVATRLLAKHDENYRPPEMKDIYKKYEAQQ